MNTLGRRVLLSPLGSPGSQGIKEPSASSLERADPSLQSSCRRGSSRLRQYRKRQGRRSRIHRDTQRSRPRRHSIAVEIGRARRGATVDPNGDGVSQLSCHLNVDSAVTIEIANNDIFGGTSGVVPSALPKGPACVSRKHVDKLARDRAIQCPVSIDVCNCPRRAEPLPIGCICWLWNLAAGERVEVCKEMLSVRVAVAIGIRDGVARVGRLLLLALAQIREVFVPF